MGSSDVSPKSRPQPRKFVLRPYRRIPTWLRCDYMSGDAVGKGVVTNLSCVGMRVLGDHSLTPGTSLAVRVLLGEDEAPVEIACATVRWVNRYDFGLQIESRRPAATRRIAALINHQARDSRFRP